MNASKKKIIGIIVFFAVLLLIMGGAYFFSQNYLVIFPIKGTSMEPTLDNGDNVLLFKTTKVDYDDVIVFYVPEDDRYLVKRVIGLPGDRIELKYSTDDSRYHVYRNGDVLSEEYIKEPMELYTELSVTVPEGKVFFLGDNRMNSFDSHMGEFADIDQIQGVAFLAYSSWKDIDFL